MDALCTVLYWIVKWSNATVGVGKTKQTFGLFCHVQGFHLTFNEWKISIPNVLHTSEASDWGLSYGTVSCKMGFDIIVILPWTSSARIMQTVEFCKYTWHLHHFLPLAVCDQVFAYCINSSKHKLFPLSKSQGSLPFNSLSFPLWLPVYYVCLLTQWVLLCAVINILLNCSKWAMRVVNIFMCNYWPPFTSMPT